MKKISTLYKKSPDDLSVVINEVNEENSWVFSEGIPTRKWDGSACMIKNGRLYKRLDVKLWKKKRGKVIKFTEEQLKAKKPIGAIPCQDADKISGHHPHWVLCDRDKPEDKYHFEAFDHLEVWEDGTYELIGEKINGNHEKVKGHMLIPHGEDVLPLYDFSFESIRTFLSNPKLDIEGIVFHNKNDGRMCKIRKCDFGIKRI